MSGAEIYELIHRIGIAVGIGLMIGIEREREKSGGFAGIRTFPLVALAGVVSAMINDRTGWSFVAGMLVVGGFIIRTYKPLDPTAPGMTTEVTAILVYLLGGLCWWNECMLAASLAAAAVLLLASKQPLENAVRKLGHEEIMAAAQLAVLSLIILPLIPNRTFGPLDVLNPRKIWIMVILVSAVNLASHLLRRLIDDRRGIEFAGLAGGLGSSTAVTLSFSRQSRKNPSLAPIYAVGILLASIVMFARVAVIVTAVQPALLSNMALRLIILIAVNLVACWFINRRLSSENRSLQSESDIPFMPRKNPLELWSAIQFGVIFSVVILVARAAHGQLGSAGVYASSAAAGLADVDAIVISLSDMASAILPSQVAVRGILLAISVNTLVKMIMILLFGDPSLRRYAGPSLVVVSATGFVLAIL